MLTLQIAVGLWLGGLFLTGSFAAYFVIADKIAWNKRRGLSWHYGLLPLPPSRNLGE